MWMNLLIINSVSTFTQVRLKIVKQIFFISIHFTFIKKSHIKLQLEITFQLLCKAMTSGNSTPVHVDGDLSWRTSNQCLMLWSISNYNFFEDSCSVFTWYYDDFLQSANWVSFKIWHCLLVWRLDCKIKSSDFNFD